VEIIYPRVAGSTWARGRDRGRGARPRDPPGERRQQIRRFKTFYQVLRQMVTWLVEQDVTHVAMEATGAYWQPVFHRLCEAEQIEVLLVNTRHVKNVPGRKTDVKASAWRRSCWNVACCVGVPSHPRTSPRSGSSPVTAKS
jgi:transposase